MKRVLLLSLVFCVLLVGSVWGANVTLLSELRQDVKNQFLLSTDVVYPDSVIDAFVNQACRDLAGYNIIQKLDTIVSVASTKYYNLNVDFLDFIGLYYVDISGERAFDVVHPSAVGKISTQLSVPGYVWIERRGVTADTARVAFYPVIATADSFVLVYSAEAVELSAATDTTNIPYEYRPLIVQYAVASCFAKGQEFNKAGWWFALYDQTLNKKLTFEQKKYDYIIKPKVIE